MTKHIRFYALAALFAVFALVASPVQAQSTITNTTLSAAVTATTFTVTVASATGAVAGSFIYVDRELMLINAASGTTLTVQRAQGGTGPQGHASGATVLVGTGAQFQSVDPNYGTCTTSSYRATTKPWVNTTNGNVWLCRFGAGGIGTWQATNPTPITGSSLTLN